MVTAKERERKVEDNAKVLIIDDEEIVLDSCTRILEGSNFQITTATNGVQGLKLAQDLQPDLVFVDLKMPGVSGMEVLEKIHAADSTVVTIVITGYATVDSAVEAMKNGAFDFLPKPFTPDEFRLIARRGLEKRRLVQETIALRREREVLREHFAAIVSHELKSPLSAIQQNLFALTAELSDKLTDAEKDRLYRCTSRIDGLLKLIHTWLRVISSDMLNIRESFKPTSVSALISQAVESMQPHAIRKDVEICAQVDGATRQVYGDAVTLTEALINLLSNAIKYSRQDSKIEIRVENKADDVVISVIDHGVGIAKEDLPFVFQDFFVGKSKSEEGGCGLGLAITRRIVQAHDGSISVESDPGKGSTFVIRLPLLKDPVALAA